MGRAIVREPKAFLFDEPLSNLDAKLRVQMRLEIKQLQRRLGTTSIYVTHDQVEAMTLADRLIVMNQGVAEHIGTPMDVYERPSTMFVASFIGSPSMNFLRATVSDDLSSIHLDGGHTLRLPEKPTRLGQQRSVTLGIRPEHIEISEYEAESIPFEVGMVETLGSDSLLYGKIQGEDELLTIRVPGRYEFKPDETLNLKLNAENFHLFDGNSQKRIQ
jgi:sn-glycerol 3-phosphate transport system ATP-binding protein